MQHVEIAKVVTLNDPSEAYRRLTRIQDYPELTDAVQTVAVHRRPDGRCESDWEVSFRDGLLCWSEEDDYDEASRCFRFRQTHGDFEAFWGEWTVAEDRMGCMVRFCASFDLGMASLSDLVEPLADRILRENIDNIIAGLFPSGR